MRGRPSGSNAEANEGGGNMLSDALISDNTGASDANLLTSNAERNMQNRNEKLI